MRKPFKHLQAQIQARQGRLKDQLKALTIFPKELRRALPVYKELCAMSSAIPCTMGEGGYLVLDDMGRRGRKEFDAAQDTVDGMIVAIAIYIERLWSTCLGSRSHDNDTADEFWDVCDEFYELSGLEGGWPQYAAAHDNRVLREKTARRGKALIDNWKRERVKAQRAVDQYRQWWDAFWKSHPELAAKYEDAQS